VLAGGLIAAVIAALMPQPDLVAAASCQSLSSLKLSDATSLPDAGWNGKFQAVGNGSWGGMLSYPAMSVALGNGYATSATDTGHADDSATFAVGHPEKLIGYAYRSEHEMTVKAKANPDDAGPRLLPTLLGIGSGRRR
jgi:hypothetical protein